MTGVVVRCTDVETGYGAARALHGVRFEASEGEFVAILGANGAGKTTLLNTIAGLTPLWGGKVDVLGSGVPSGKPHLLARRGVGYVPDDRGLLRGLTGWEHLRLAGGRPGEVSPEVLEAFPGFESRLGLKAGVLSGGEQQMLTIAKTLSMNPRLLMIDELSLGLAPVIIEQLMPLLRRLAHERGIGVVVVDQHVDLALRYSDRAYVMRRGEIALTGESAALRTQDEELRASYLGESVSEPAGAER